MNTRRNHLDKENFLEGNRQKWCMLYTVIGLLIALATGFGFIPDPGPFMTYFTGIGVTFILGASGSDIMKSYTIKSAYENGVYEKTENINETRTEKIEHVYHEGDEDAPTRRPFYPDLEHNEDTYDRR